MCKNWPLGKLVLKYTQKKRELSKVFLPAINASVRLCKGMN